MRNCDAIVVSSGLGVCKLTRFRFLDKPLDARAKKRYGSLNKTAIQAAEIICK